MELFVINRYLGENDEVQDSANYKNLLRRIAEKSLSKVSEKSPIVQIDVSDGVSSSTETVVEAKNEERPKCHPQQSSAASTDDEIEDNDTIESHDNTPKEANGDLSDFTILKSDQFKKPISVTNITPTWIQKATVFSSDLQNLDSNVDEFTTFDQCEQLRTNLKSIGIKCLFPVQKMVIPFIVDGQRNRSRWRPNDVCVAAPTGSGKTFTYILPIVQELMMSRLRMLRALVILPTRHLAVQVYHCFRQMLKNIDLKVTLIIGNKSFAKEVSELVSQSDVFGTIQKCDIIVTTAGKLVDHLKHPNGINLENLRFLVIDEVDRILDTLDQDWLHHLKTHFETNYKMPYVFNPLLCLSALNNSRPGPQKLLFSATFPDDPDLLEKIGLFEPKLFTSASEGKFLRPNELVEKMLFSPLEIKPLILFKLIELNQLTKSLIFVNSVESVHRLTYLLEILFESSPRRIEKLSSNLSVQYQNSVIKSFSDGFIDLLVSTDALARGMDLANVENVINYDMPRFIETYIHRSGRTARAGRAGNVITLVEPKRKSQFQKMLHEANRLQNIELMNIDYDNLLEAEEKYRLALKKLKLKIENEQSTKKGTMKALKRKSKR